ncbi:hypothetical protein CR513_34279, partial [Mucuna pruriens]
KPRKRTLTQERTTIHGELQGQGVSRVLSYAFVKDPMGLFCYNNFTNIAHNPIQHDRTKHVEINQHFIKEQLDIGLITTAYILGLDWQIC